MNLDNRYLFFAAIVAFILVTANELGYGVIAFLPLTLLTAWLLGKAFGQ